MYFNMPCSWSDRLQQQLYQYGTICEQHLHYTINVQQPSWNRYIPN